jgi:hypothetical protein
VTAGKYNDYKLTTVPQVSCFTFVRKPADAFFHGLRIGRLSFSRYGSHHLSKVIVI